MAMEVFGDSLCFVLTFAWGHQDIAVNALHQLWWWHVHQFPALEPEHMDLPGSTASDHPLGTSCELLNKNSAELDVLPDPPWLLKVCHFQFQFYRWR